jgi:sulfatase maturation enzyme AslB (radical SAM superfamily)
MIKLEDYVCVAPFEYLEVTSHGGVFGCCPGWLNKASSKLEDVSTVWDSEGHKEIQQSILDGSYRYCSKEQCPALNQLVNKGVVNNGFFIPKKDFDIEKYKFPKTINYAFDRSCNLSCPSCRENIIMADGVELDKIEWVMNEIERSYGNTLQRIYLSGTAEPFASKSYRKLLTEFNKKKYPKVYNIQLHTNGTLFNQKMWNDMKTIQPFIKTIEISIDAATKETYEKLRRGGKWESLIENLHFINTLPITDVILSMIVQDTNYKEISLFYENMLKIFPTKGRTYFKKICNWHTFTKEEFMDKEVFNPKHPKFEDFLIELKKINNKHNCVHNFHDIMSQYIKNENTLI